MRFHGGSTVAVAAAATLLGGCATSGALKRANEQNQSALAAQRTELTGQLTAERAERAASDSALRAELGMVRGDVQALRTELQTLRTDFGAKIAMVQDGLRFAMPVNFAFDATNVRDEDHAALDRFSHVVQQYYPGSKVTIEGFADPAGSARYNMTLSTRRATAVRDYLVAQGLTGSQLMPSGYGKTRLVTPGASHDQPGAEQNRRVVFVIETKAQSSVAMAPEGQQ
jgi:peptidoglycan-associated lipoprotein